jgi:hypothetical protein
LDVIGIEVLRVFLLAITVTSTMCKSVRDPPPPPEQKWSETGL